MKKRLIIDGNAIYEIDEECMKRKGNIEKTQSVKKKKTIQRHKKRTE